MIATAFKRFNVTSRSVRHRCLRSMSTMTNDSMLTLENTNPHHMDARITSDPSRNTFLFDDFELAHDIPLIVEEAFPKFDPEEAVKRMMASSTWPRQPYIKKDGTPYSANGVKMRWKENASYKERTDSEIIENIHLLLNDKPQNFKEMAQFKVFLHEVIQGKGIVPYRTQWRIASGSDRTHGLVHFLGKFSDGTYALIDWDRNRSFGNEQNNQFEKFACEPIANLYDCTASKAYMRINLKRYILQKCYDINVSYMAVAVFHPLLETDYDLFEAPLLEQEAVRLIKETRKHCESS